METPPPEPKTSLRTVLLLSVIGVIVLIGLIYIGRRDHRYTPPQGRDVVSYAGLGDIHFGDSNADLRTRHGLHASTTDCRQELSDPAHVGADFVDGKLVMLWIKPPLHTPEGVTVGSTVDDVRRAYPDATMLAPSAPYRFAALLVVHGDMGYLFLYQGNTVQKTVVGYHDYLRQLFDRGADSC